MLSMASAISSIIMVLSQLTSYLLAYVPSSRSIGLVELTITEPRPNDMKIGILNGPFFS